MSETVLYTLEELKGRYSERIGIPNWCVSIPDRGVLFSLTFPAGGKTDNPVRAAVVVHLEGDRDPIEARFEGKFMPEARSGYTGRKIPCLLHMLAPQNLGLSVAALRASRFELMSISEIDGPSAFDGFRVRY